MVTHSADGTLSIVYDLFHIADVLRFRFAHVPSQSWNIFGSILGKIDGKMAKMGITHDSVPQCVPCTQ